MVMKSPEIANLLDKYNEWRRGNVEECPCTPRELGTVIDFAVVDLTFPLRISDVVEVVDSMSDFETEEERVLFMDELRTNLGAL